MRAMRPRIKGRSVFCEVIVNATLYDPDLFLQVHPGFQHLEWGSFIQAFAENGREHIQEQLNVSS